MPTTKKPFEKLPEGYKIVSDTDTTVPKFSKLPKGYTVLSDSDTVTSSFDTVNFIGQVKQSADQEKKITNFVPESFNGLNDDEEKIINEMQVRGQWSKDEAEYAKKVIRGELPEQKEQSKVVSSDNALGWFYSPGYYFDPSNKGLPKPLKMGEKPPPNVSLESFWGANKLAFESASGVKLKSKIDAEDDSFLTTALKSAANAFINIAQIPTLFGKAGESIVTGKEGDFSVANTAVDNFLTRMRSSLSSDAQAPLLTDKFKDISDFLNSDSYNITGQNLSSLIGQVVGSLSQFGVVGKGVSGITKTLTGAEKLSKTQSIVSGLFAGQMVNMKQTMDDAYKGNVTPREAALMGIGNSIVYSMIEQFIGGPDARFLRGMESSGTFSKMSKTLLKTIKENGNIINPTNLSKAFVQTLETGMKDVPKITQLVKNIVKESGEETLQQMESRASEQLFNTLAGYNGYAGEFGDTKNLKSYFESALAGAIGGLGGGAFEIATGHREYDEKDARIYDYVRMGQSTQLKQELVNMQKSRKISTEDVKSYSTLIDAYEGYYKQLSNKNLSRENGAKVFENAFNIEHLEGQIKEKESSHMTPIQKGEVEVLKEKVKEYQKEINDVLKGQKTFVEEPVKTEGEEQQPVSVPVDVHTIAPFKWNKMRPSDKKVSLASHLKTQTTPVTGTISKRVGSVTAFSFVDTQGKSVVFYNHPEHGKITEEDLSKPAELVLVPEKTNDKGEKFIDVVQVKIGDKIIGNVQETNFEKSVKSATKSEMREVPLPTEEPGMQDDTFTATYEEIVEAGIATGVDLSKKTRAKLGKLGFSTPMVESMSREDIETAKTFTSPEDAVEMVDKYTRKVAEKSGEEIPFNKPPVTVKEKKKAIPKTRKTAKSLMRDPESLEEAIVQLLLTTRIKTEELIRHTGFGKKDERTGKTHGLTEFRKLIWAHKKDGTPLDMFVEAIPEQYTEGLQGMDLTNKILEVLTTHMGKAKLIERLQELQSERVQEISPEDIEKYMEDQEVYDELRGIELKETPVSDEEIQDVDDNISQADKTAIDAFVAKHTDENGVTDWESVDKVLNSDEVYDLPQDTFHIVDNLKQKADENINGKGKENQEEGISDAPGKEQEKPEDGTEGSEGEIKYQTASTVKEIEGKLETAKSKLEAAKKKVISKRTELLKTKLADTEDLFGEKQSEQEEQLFYQQTEGDIEKILEPQKNDVKRAEAEVEKLTKQLDAAKNDNSQTEMQFQGKNDELLEISDPKLAKYIRTKLKKLFPKVQVFDDADEFQKFLDKNYPGKKLDLSKLGAAIGDAIYINPQSAVQSTAIHEHAHIYWDMMPDDYVVKEDMLELFDGNEEAVITAIGQAGVDIAKVELDGGLLARFKSMLKTFWAKTKDLFGIATKADLARIMANDIWKHGAVDMSEKSSSDIKFMSPANIQQAVVDQITSISEYLNFNEKNHTYTNKQGDIKYTSVTALLDTEQKYKFEGMNAEDARLRGRAVDEIVEAIIKGTDPLKVLEKSDITMDKSVVESLTEQLTSFIESIKKDGVVLTQTMIANNSYKVAGRTDIIVVRKDGTLDIYDVKSSKIPTTRPGYSKSTISKGKEKASKKDLHGVQMGMYGYLAESPDMLFGSKGHKIGKLAVVPIKLDAEGKNITGATLEPIIESDYQQYRDEAERIINNEFEKSKEVDREMNEEMEALTQKQYFSKAQVYVDGEKMSIEKHLKSLKEDKDAYDEQYKKYLDQYKQYTIQVKNASQITYNLETATTEQMLEAYNLIYGYDNLVQNLYLDGVSRIMRDKLIADQKERTGKKDESERPFTWTEAYFTRPSKVTEEHPYIQAVAREKLLADEENMEETNKIKKEFKKYSDALKKEKRKGESVGSKVLRGLSASLDDKSKYFKNLVKKDGNGRLRLKNYRNSDDASTLSTAEMNYLKHYTDVMEKMYGDVNAEGQITDGFFPQLSPSFFENAYNTGIMKAISSHFYNDRLEDVILNYDDGSGQKKFMRYEDVVDNINQQADAGILQKAVKAVRLRNVRERAEKALENRRGEDGKKIVKSESGYRLMANGKLQPKTLKEKEQGQQVSLDLDKAFIAYVEDMNNVKYMNKVMPYAKSLLDYYRKKGDDHEFTKKFVETFVLGDIQGTKIEKSTKFTKAIQFAQMWTYLNVMTFNVPAAILNISQGVAQLIKNELFISGSKRFFVDWKKAQAVIDKYSIVSVEHTDVFESGAGLFTYLANGANVFAETYLQGAAFIAQFSQEEWDNFNADGTVKDESLVPSKQDIGKMKSKKNDLMGAYDRGDKRMYKHWALGSAAMQFKGWIPDWIASRLAKENVDIYGNKQKGSWRSLRLAADHLATLLKDPKTFFTSEDADMKANRGHLKNAVYLALLVSMAAGASDDDRDKVLSAKLWRAVNDMSGVFNLSTMDFIVTQPMPFLGTLHNFIGALKSIPDTYTKDGRFGEKGDWMFPGKILNVLPYNHLGKELFSSPNYR